MSEETRCRICGRRLTVPESVKREIGPVCWGRLKRAEVLQFGRDRRDLAQPGAEEGG